MNNAAINTILAARNINEIADLNDWAVSTIREYCNDKGYDSNVLYCQEVSRIVDAQMSLDTYRKCSRAGSKFRVTRSIRRAIWVAAKTRKACRNLSTNY